MRTVYECVDTFATLLHTKYEVILGRKSRSVKLNISFEKTHCYHLMGLQYLKDLPELRKDRAKIFDALLNRKISNTKLESSVFYSQIEERIHYLPLLEAMLDDNSTVFKYNEN